MNEINRKNEEATEIADEMKVGELYGTLLLLLLKLCPITEAWLVLLLLLCWLGLMCCFLALSRTAGSTRIGQKKMSRLIKKSFNLPNSVLFSCGHQRNLLISGFACMLIETIHL